MRIVSSWTAMALLGVSLWCAPVRAEDCARRFTSAEVSLSLTQAESAFSQLEEETFEKQMVEASGQLRCVSEPMPVPVVAQYHRLMGIRAFLARDMEAANAAFASARLLDPAYAFPDGVLPPKHPIRALYTGAQAKATPVDPPAIPEKGQLYFDGSPSTQRPAGRATIFQVVDKQGPTLSAYLYPTAPLPDYPLQREEVATAPHEPRKSAAGSSGRTLRLGLLGAGGASLLASGAVELMAFRAQATFNAAGTQGAGVLEELQADVNRRTLVASGLGVVGAGLVTTGLIVGSW